MSNEQRFLCEAIELAHSNVEKGGRAVVVRNDQVIATGVNFDPIACHENSGSILSQWVGLFGP